MIKVYGFPQTRSRRITWMLEELEQEYEFVLVDFNKGEAQSAKYLAINPAGKVPAMGDDELLLTESAAILTYLGDKYPEMDLVPAPGRQHGVNLISGPISPCVNWNNPCGPWASTVLHSPKNIVFRRLCRPPHGNFNAH